MRYRRQRQSEGSGEHLRVEAHSISRVHDKASVDIQNDELIPMDRRIYYNHSIAEASVSMFGQRFRLAKFFPKGSVAVGKKEQAAEKKMFIVKTLAEREVFIIEDMCV